jgi:hypothetical protein
MKHVESRIFYFMPVSRLAFFFVPEYGGDMFLRKFTALKIRMETHATHIWEMYTLNLNRRFQSPCRSLALMTTKILVPLILYRERVNQFKSQVRFALLCILSTRNITVRDITEEHSSPIRNNFTFIRKVEEKSETPCASTGMSYPLAAPYLPIQCDGAQLISRGKLMTWLSDHVSKLITNT